MYLLHSSMYGYKHEFSFMKQERLKLCLTPSCPVAKSFSPFPSLSFRFLPFTIFFFFSFPPILLHSMLLLFTLTAHSLSPLVLFYFPLSYPFLILFHSFPLSLHSLSLSFLPFPSITFPFPYFPLLLTDVVVKIWWRVVNDPPYVILCVSNLNKGLLYTLHETKNVDSP